MAFKYPTIHLSVLILLISLIGSTLATPLIPRDSPNNRCGPQFGGNSCNAVGSVNRCCSQYNYCGDSSAHCGTGCQPGYGNCGGTTTSPPTTQPSITPRPKFGNVPYGVSIYSCTVPGTIAITYDDGPYEYTTALLDILAKEGVKVTFFITGNNLDKGAIDAPGSRWSGIIRRAYNEGHQIGSHTWTHPDMDSVSETERRFQMTRNEQAFVNIINRYPTYMRPPYIRCSTPCARTMDALGYHMIIWDLDTDDYNNVTPELIQNSKNRVRDAILGSDPSTRSFLSIAHDIHYQTVYNLTMYQINFARSNGYRPVTIGECLGDPASNWYRTQ